MLFRKAKLHGPIWRTVLVQLCDPWSWQCNIRLPYWPQNQPPCWKWVITLCCTKSLGRGRGMKVWQKMPHWFQTTFKLQLSKLWDFSYDLSGNVLVWQLFAHLFWRFCSSHVFEGYFSEFYCISQLKSMSIGNFGFFLSFQAKCLNFLIGLEAVLFKIFKTTMVGRSKMPDLLK